VIIEQATIDDLPAILAMRKEASNWLAERGIEAVGDRLADTRGAVRPDPVEHPGW
jgi:hypothetical protein